MSISKLNKFILKLLPLKYHYHYSIIILKILTPFYFGSKVECPCCKKKYKAFGPRFTREIIKDQYCFNCHSFPRHRVISIFIEKYVKKGRLKILHFAPEPCLQKSLKASPRFEHTSADINSKIADIEVNISKMNLKSNIFDLIICSHVLEHVEDDIGAIKEIYRVLKPQGEAIVMVPIDKKSKHTFFDPNIKSPEDREKYYGFKNHLRLYGLDFTNKLEEAGFDVTTIDLRDKLSKEAVAYYGVDEDCNHIYLCKKH